MTEKILPLGSVVMLKEGLVKLMVIARGAVYEDPETGEDKYVDYMAILYPSGMDPENSIFFNHCDIDKVVHKGFVDDEEARFLEIHEEWKAKIEREAEKKYLDEHTFGF